MFIVLWDDQFGVCVPMGFDSECPGALEAAGTNSAVAVFPNRPTARRAIDISAKHAALRKAQGLPSNDDFLGAARKFLRIAELREWKPPA